jgi:hypothetical protein
MGLAVFISGALSSASCALPPLPKTGEVIERSDDHLGPWSIFEHGLFGCGALIKNCSYVLLHSDSAIVVAMTKPTIVDSRGGYLAELITKTFVIIELRGDEHVDCGRIDGHDTIVNLLNKRTKTLRAFYVEHDRLASLTQKYKGEPPCDVGEN